ncbi:PEP-utilizing enzyme [Hirschfeldia incana]|nr:PEP-utilizing enzyme [Hirschfeldia incana]
MINFFTHSTESGGERLTGVSRNGGGASCVHGGGSRSLACSGKERDPCSKETIPEDVGGIHAAEGILTARGGTTSHAAVVARGWGKCCIAGCSEIRNISSFENLREAWLSS